MIVWWLWALEFVWGRCQHFRVDWTGWHLRSRLEWGNTLLVSKVKRCHVILTAETQAGVIVNAQQWHTYLYHEPHHMVLMASSWCFTCLLCSSGGHLLIQWQSFLRTTQLWSGCRKSDMFRREMHWTHWMWGYVRLRNLQRSMKLLRSKGRSNICQAKCQRPRSWRIKGLCHLVPQDVFALNLFNLFMFIPCSFHVPCWCWAWMCNLL